MFLETTDGVGILGYAGLGLTGEGTEPGDWMSRVLRGRNLPFESMLGVLTAVARTELLRHLEGLNAFGTPSHSIAVPAFVNRKPCMYSICFLRAQSGTGYWHEYRKNICGGDQEALHLPRTVGVSGSGGPHLLRNPEWVREFLSAVRAHNKGRISAQEVAKVFSTVNSRVADLEPSVGHRCIVAWRYRDGGGAHAMMDRACRDMTPGDDGWIPAIARGADSTANIRAVFPRFGMPQAPGERHWMDFDTAEIDTALAALPRTPDERLT